MPRTLRLKIAGEYLAMLGKMDAKPALLKIRTKYGASSRSVYRYVRELRGKD